MPDPTEQLLSQLVKKLDVQNHLLHALVEGMENIFLIQAIGVTDRTESAETKSAVEGLVRDAQLESRDRKEHIASISSGGDSFDEPNRVNIKRKPPFTL